MPCPGACAEHTSQRGACGRLEADAQIHQHTSCRHTSCRLEPPFRPGPETTALHVVSGASRPRAPIFGRVQCETTPHPNGTESHRPVIVPYKQCSFHPLAGRGEASGPKHKGGATPAGKRPPSWTAAGVSGSPGRLEPWLAGPGPSHTLQLRAHLRHGGPRARSSRRGICPGHLGTTAGMLGQQHKEREK